MCGLFSFSRHMVEYVDAAMFLVACLCTAGLGFVLGVDWAAKRTRRAVAFIQQEVHDA